MNKYTYQELTKKVNAYFKDNIAAHVTERTLRFWINDGILPKPKGAGRCWHFEEDHFREIVSIRKLQFSYGQSIEDIKSIHNLADAYLNPADSTLKMECYFNLSKVIMALESAEKFGTNPASELDSFKKGNRLLIKDIDYSPPYRFVDEEKYHESFIEEGGKVYRVFESLPNLEGEAVYFTNEQLAEFLSRINETKEHIVKVQKPTNTKTEAEEIRVLVDDGIMTSPRYRYKGKNYFSASNLLSYQHWKSLLVNYGFDKDKLKLLRKRIESDVESYFYVPEEPAFVESHLYYKFQRQVVLFETCLFNLMMCLFLREESITNHTIEDSKKILRDYLDGFLFLCNSFTGTMCLKKTPLDRLSPEQIKTGLTQGKFARREVERVIRNRETEVKVLKLAVKQNAKGGRHDTLTKNSPLFFDENIGKDIYENDLTAVEGDHCPKCGKPIEEENKEVVFGINSRLLGWIEKTGQLIKKCQCKAWLKMPYRLSRTI